MQKFTLVIELGNDAMQTPNQIADAIENALAKVRKIYETQDFNGKIKDVNGNTVGVWGID